MGPEVSAYGRDAGCFGPAVNGGHLRQAVAVIALGIHEMTGEEISELQQTEKVVEETNPAKVRQIGMIRGDSETSRRSAHPRVSANQK